MNLLKKQRKSLDLQIQKVNKNSKKHRKEIREDADN